MFIKTRFLISISVKRKYTKRKGVLNPPAPSPRKRVKSAPSTIPSLADSPLNQQTTSDLAGVSDLTDLLQSQRTSQANLRTLGNEQSREQLLQACSEQSISRDLLGKRPAIIPCQSSTTGQDTRQIIRPFSPKSLPSTNILGNLHEPFGAEKNLASTSTNYSSPVTSIHQALLMSLQRQKPPVHITTASTVANQIQQLLATMPRNTTAVSPTSSPMIPQSIPVSPIQSKVPTLVNSLSSSVPAVVPSAKPNISHHQVGIINIVPGSSTDKMASEKLEKERMETRDREESRERQETKQKLQFHDFPLTLTSLSSTQTSSIVTQARVLSNKSLEAETQSQSKPQAIHITVNKSSHSAQMASTFANLTQALSSLGSSKPSPNIIITAAGSQTKETNTSQTLSSGTSTVTFKPAPETSVPKSVGLPYVGATTVSAVGSLRQQEKPHEVEESLGKVSSLLESSPITEKAKTVTMSPESTHSNTGVSVVHIKPNIVSGAPASSSGHHVTKSSAPKAPSVTVTSYTPTAKPVLSTTASTRTRRIRTPKQYDL